MVEDRSTRDEIVAFVRGLPKQLRQLVNHHDVLDDSILQQADAVIAFGSDTTMESLRAKTRWDQRFLPHGHAVSLLWLAARNALTDRQTAACAMDILAYDQLGCLSPQAIYLPPLLQAGATRRKTR